MPIIKIKMLKTMRQLPQWFTRKDYEYFRSVNKAPCWATFHSYVSVKKLPMKDKSGAPLYCIEKQKGWLK